MKWSTDLWMTIMRFFAQTPVNERLEMLIRVPAYHPVLTQEVRDKLNALYIGDRSLKAERSWGIQAFLMAQTKIGKEQEANKKAEEGEMSWGMHDMFSTTNLPDIVLPEYERAWGSS